MDIATGNLLGSTFEWKVDLTLEEICARQPNLDSVQLLTVGSTGKERNVKRWLGTISPLGQMLTGGESVHETLVPMKTNAQPLR